MSSSPPRARPLARRLAPLALLSACAQDPPAAAVVLDAACGIERIGLPPLRTGRCDHALVRMSLDDVLVIGGAAAASLDQPPLRSCERIDVRAGTIAAFPPLRQARRGAIAAWLHGGFVLVAGGFDGTSALADAELYDPSAGAWQPLPPMREARAFASACTLGDGRILIAGGASGSGRLDPGGNGRVLRSAEIFDPEKRAWTQAGAMRERRAFAALVALDDGSALVLGGIRRAPPAGSAETEVLLATVEHFDRSTLAWTERSPMLAAHGPGVAASVLERGRLLIEAFPGRALRSGETAFELYDLVKDAWSAVEPTRAHGALPWPGARGPMTRLVSAAGQMLLQDPHRLGAAGLWLWDGETGAGFASDAACMLIGQHTLLRAGGTRSSEGAAGVLLLRLETAR